MVSSQDTAVAAALTQLGYKLDPLVEVLAVTKGLPADGKLEVARRDRCGSTARRSPAPRTSSTPSTPRRPGSRSPFVVRRGEEGGGRRRDPREGRRGTSRIGITPGSATTSRSTSASTRRQHRRAQRRADVLAGHLRHPHPGLADRRRRHRRHRHHHAGRQGRTDRRHPAEDRRRRGRRREALPRPGRQLRRHRAEWTRTTCAW